ncbi:MAG: phosphoribosylformylglycinamidine synthase, partial [Deltaproteobacteria bacterium]|nr:phosphoribosylformylglycinamidine synthase [Deltaproteobacteria bacterium]
DYTVAYSIPCISGKDSMKNDYGIGDHKISIPPTVLFSVIGRIEDVRRACTMDLKRAGDLVYVLGLTRDETGASEYNALRGCIGNKVPQVNAPQALARYRALHAAISGGLVRSCHDCSDGGLGVALAETAFAGGLGLEVDLRGVPAEAVDRNDTLLFSESQSRFVVSIAPESRAAFESCMQATVWACIGTVRADTRFSVTGLAGTPVVTADLQTLKAAWQKTLDF